MPNKTEQAMIDLTEMIGQRNTDLIQLAIRHLNPVVCENCDRYTREGFLCDWCEA